MSCAALVGMAGASTSAAVQVLLALLPTMMVLLLCLHRVVVTWSQRRDTVEGNSGLSARASSWCDTRHPSELAAPCASHTSHVTRHTSLVTRHSSCGTSDTLQIKRHVSHSRIPVFIPRPRYSPSRYRCALAGASALQNSPPRPSRALSTTLNPFYTSTDCFAGQRAVAHCARVHTRVGCAAAAAVWPAQTAQALACPASS